MIPAAPPLQFDLLDARERATLSPAVADAIRSFRSPRMPAEADYALVKQARYPFKPLVFTSLADLARHIHRMRGDDALELKPWRLVYGGGLRHVTEVLATDQVADRTRRIGYAWHKGEPREVLQAALDACWPDMGVALAAGRVS